MAHVITERAQSVPVPIPKNWDPSMAKQDISDMSLDHARFMSRNGKGARYLAQWEARAAALAVAASNLDDAIHAFFEAPEGGIASRVSFRKWDLYSVVEVEAAEGPQELCRLHRLLGTKIAKGGEAEAKLIAKIDKLYARRE